MQGASWGLCNDARCHACNLGSDQLSILLRDVAVISAVSATPLQPALGRSAVSAAESESREVGETWEGGGALSTGLGMV